MIKEFKEFLLRATCSTWRSPSSSASPSPPS